jgi:hypothetical protein
MTKSSYSPLKPKSLENVADGVLVFPIFTTDEKDYLRGELKKYQHKTVEKFLLHLEILCQDILALMKCTPERTVHIKNLKKMKKSFESTLKYLRQFEKGRIEFDYNRSLAEKIENTRILEFDYGAGEFVRDGDEKNDEEAESLVNSIFDASDNLCRVVKYIEEKLNDRKGKRGRAEPYTIGFVKAIAEIYERYLEKPTNYQDSPFYSVVEFALESVGLPHKAPRRAIEKALKGDSVQK